MREYQIQYMYGGWEPCGETSSRKSLKTLRQELMMRRAEYPEIRYRIAVRNVSKWREVK